MSDKKIKVLYILGGGHSGSTILSLILGTAAEVFNAGELKLYNQHFNPSSSRWNKINPSCMCGKDALECPFWQQVAQISPDLNIFYQPGLRGYSTQLFRWISHLNRQNTNDDYLLFSNTLTTAKSFKPSLTYILDMSKSLPRYLHIKSNPNIEIATFFLIRDGFGYLNSYRKRHQKGFLRWIVQWAMVNLSVFCFLKLSKEPYYHLSYNKLCLNPEKYLKEINQFFDISIPSNFVEAVNQTEFHVRGGNAAVIDQKSFAGLNLDDQWKKQLTSFQIRLASLVILPLNKLFSV
jgi:hypothetical protein